MMLFSLVPAFLSLCASMELKPESPPLLPEILDKIVSFAEIKDIQSWSKVSRRFEDTAANVLSKKFLRKNVSGHFEPDLSKMMQVYPDLSEEERSLLKNWDLRAFDHFGLLKFVPAEDYIGCNTHIEWSDSVKMVTYFFSNHALSSLPSVFGKLNFVNENGFVDTVSLMASFPVLDDITIRIFNENPNLVSFEMCQQVASIRGKCKVLESCTSHLDEADQWKLLDVTAKDIDMSHAKNLFQNSKVYMETCGFLDFVKYIFSTTDDKEILMPMLETTFEMWVAEFSSDLYSTAYSFLNEILILASKDKELADLITQTATTTLSKSRIEPEDFQDFILTFAETIDDEILKPIFEILMKTFNGVLNSDVIIDELIRSENWENLLLASKFLALGPTNLIQEFVLKLAELGAFDKFVMEIMKHNSKYITAETLFQLAKIKQVDVKNIMDMESWQKVDLGNFLEKIDLAVVSGNQKFVRFIARNMMRNKFHEDVILEFLEKNFILTQSDEELYFTHASDTVDHLINMYALCDELPRVQNLISEKLEERISEIEKAGQNSLILKDLLDCIFRAARFSKLSKPNINKLADIFCRCVNQEIISSTESLPVEPEEEIILLAMALRKFEPSEVQSRMEDVLSYHELSKIFIVFSSSETPVEKIGFIFDRVYRSRGKFYSFLKGITASDKTCNADYIVALLDHNEFEKHVNYLCSNDEGFEILMNIMSRYNISKAAKEIIFNALTTYEHSAQKMNKFLTLAESE